MYLRAIITLLPAILLGGCFINPAAGPVIEEAEAGCLTDEQTGDDYWLLDARVTHPDGLDIVNVFVDVEDADGFEVFSVSLDELEPFYWAAEVVDDPQFLDCTPGFAYWFTFIAVDENDNQDESVVVN